MNSLQSTARTWYGKKVGIIPVKRMSKQAAIKWKHLQSSRAPWPIVKKWFSNDAQNIGIMCGAVSGNLAVLDFDELEVYQDWREVHKYHLANSYSVETARGMHVYLYVDDLPDATFKIPGVDVKCSGYVLGAGSVHPCGVDYTAIGGDILRVTCLDLALVGLKRPKLAENEEGEHTAVHVIPPPFSAISATSNNTYQVKLYPGIIHDIKSRLSILDAVSWYTKMSSEPGNAGYHWGTCPAHQDEKPSFSVSVKNGRCHCWSAGCRLHTQDGLDVIDFVSRMESIRERQAMILLGKQLGLLDDNGRIEHT
ncbi:MAG: hypothetical protein GY832_36285 [Chloroflexi bacterium]|nr:hypothetical protein [Chloroflexota bacterium]